jgi:predicted Zn-dependent protease
MKKIAITLIALAAVSTAAFANSNRSYDLRDTPDFVSAYAGQANVISKSESAMAMGNSQAPTAADRLIRNQEKNLTGH